MMPKRSLPIFAELVLSELQQEAAFEKQSIDDDYPSVPQSRSAAHCPILKAVVLQLRSAND